MSTEDNKLSRQIGGYGSDLILAGTSLDLDDVPMGWHCMLAEDADVDTVIADVAEGSSYSDDGTLSTATGSAKAMAKGDAPFFGKIIKINHTGSTGAIRAYRRGKE